ncbi:MAG TPA: hypothetical protein VHL60_03230 [Oxalicibacterium sp.]|nr:hypothetical protein [Oxalicibacterium sp.]
MTQLDLFLPFGLPPPEMARDLLRELKMPALAMLLARATRIEHQTTDDFSRALPHEIRLAHLLGLPDRGMESSPAIATAMMRRFDLSGAEGTWFMLQPVHLHIAQDHLVLTDPRQLALSEEEARALFSAVQPLFDEYGHTLLFGDASTWFLRANAWADLQTSTPDAASGHNVDIWMPKGKHERDWRRLQNEVQMHWHTHAVNEAREMSGRKVVNSIWLWGGAPASASAGSDNGKTNVTGFTLPGSIDPYAMSLEHAVPVTSVDDIVRAAPRHGVLILDELTGLALGNAWAEWLATMGHYEAIWFAPLLAALRNGDLDRLTITVSHDHALATYAAGKSSLRKFWRKPSLVPLAA